MEYYSALKRKEILIHATYNIDELWGRCAKWNKPVTKGPILYDSTMMKHLD